MPDTIQIPDVPRVAAHLVPCHIQYSGPANTKEYFTPTKSNETRDDAPVDIAYFRGLRLVGQTTNLRDLKLRGYLLDKSESIERQEQHSEDPYSEPQLVTVHTHTAIASFDTLTVYGHDSVVERDNQWRLLDEWAEMAEIIHL